MQYSLKGEEQLVGILPSHIFGSIPFLSEKTGPPNNKTGREVYLLSSNIRNKFDPNSPREKLLSPSGYLINSFTTTEPYPSNIYAANNMKSDFGSSGGAYMDLSTNKAIGVFSGEEDIPGKAIGKAIGQKIPDEISDLIANRRKRIDPRIYPEPKPNPTFNPSLPNPFLAREYKGINFEPKVLSCPEGHVAAGVIASTVTRRGKDIANLGMIGNLGLICLPYTRDLSVYQSYGNGFIRSQISQFDHATVISGGSLDTKLTPTNNMLFDEYFASHRSPGFATIFSGWFTGKPQSFAMCPPGYFLRGLNILPGIDGASRSTIIRAILSLECRRGDFNSSADFTRTPRIPMGAENVKVTPENPILTRNCVEGFISGMKVFAGDITYGFEFNCKSPHSSIKTIVPKKEKKWGTVTPVP